jgi:hypothetical protein
MLFNVFGLTVANSYGIEIFSLAAKCIVKYILMNLPATGVQYLLGKSLEMQLVQGCDQTCECQLLELRGE